MALELARAAHSEAPTTSELLPCDVVMKGGITSGVVYPAAVRELARTYRFMSIGGTSAGAIAAACTAAAEFGRQNGDPNAFEGLEKLSQELGANGFILKLFQPTPSTRALFDIVMAFVGSKPLYLKACGALWGTFVRFLPLTLGALVFDALFGWWLLTMAAPWIIWPLAAVTMAIVLCCAWALGLWWTLAKAIPRNYLGLCNGSGASGRTLPLTDWLADKIDTLAGIDKEQAPLTFGALWGIGGSAELLPTPAYTSLPPLLEGPAPTLDQIRGSASINLEMMTTCVTLGRPFRLPFAARIFFIDPADARALFPARVANWLLTHSARPRSRQEAILYRLLEPLVPIPPAAEWFKSEVKTGGPWDFKNHIAGGSNNPAYPSWDYLGNFNYGATAAALGIPETYALRSAHTGQESTVDPGDPGALFLRDLYPWLARTPAGEVPVDFEPPDPDAGTPPYWDKIADQDQIKNGWEYFSAWLANGGKTPCVCR